MDTRTKWAPRAPVPEQPKRRGLVTWAGLGRLALLALLAVLILAGLAAWLQYDRGRTIKIRIGRAEPSAVVLSPSPRGR